MDALGQLTERFNRLIDKIRNLISEVKEKSATVRNMSIDEQVNSPKLTDDSHKLIHESVFDMLRNLLTELSP